MPSPLKVVIHLSGKMMSHSLPALPPKATLQSRREGVGRHSPLKTRDGSARAGVVVVGVVVVVVDRAEQYVAQP